MCRRRCRVRRRMWLGFRGWVCDGVVDRSGDDGGSVVLGSYVRVFAGDSETLLSTLHVGGCWFVSVGWVVDQWGGVSLRCAGVQHDRCGSGVGEVGCGGCGGAAGGADGGVGCGGSGGDGGVGVVDGAAGDAEDPLTGFEVQAAADSRSGGVG